MCRSRVKRRCTVCRFKPFATLAGRLGTDYTPDRDSSRQRSPASRYHSKQHRMACASGRQAEIWGGYRGARHSAEAAAGAKLKGPSGPPLDVARARFHLDDGLDSSHRCKHRSPWLRFMANLPVVTPCRRVNFLVVGFVFCCRVNCFGTRTVS